MKNEKEKEWLEGKKIEFVNGIIHDVVIEIIGHFGNIVTMDLLIDTPEGCDLCKDGANWKCQVFATIQKHDVKDRK